eukprot:364358_1
MCAYPIQPFFAKSIKFRNQGVLRSLREICDVELTINGSEAELVLRGTQENMEIVKRKIKTDLGITISQDPIIKMRFWINHRNFEFQIKGPNRATQYADQKEYSCLIRTPTYDDTHMPFTDRAVYV